MTEDEREGYEDGRAVRFRLPRLALRGLAGAELGPRAGESLEFQDYRDYTPGDDLRNLDWNVLARTEREVVKVRREEIAPVIELFRDRSASMSVPPAKLRTADYLAGLVAGAAKTAKTVERDEPKTPRAVRILLGDLLTDEDPDAALARLARQAAAVIVIRVLAREETDPPAVGAFTFTDAETGETREIVIDEPTRRDYLCALTAHTARWQAACRRHGATFIDVSAEAPRPARLAALAAAGVLEGSS